MAEKMKNALSGIFGSVYIFLLGLALWALLLGLLSFFYAGSVSRTGESPSSLINPIPVYPFVFALAAFVVGRTKKGKNHALMSPAAYLLIVGSSLLISFDPPDEKTTPLLEYFMLFSPIILIPVGYAFGRKLQSHQDAGINSVTSLRDSTP
jgi:hypothetical protein